MKSIVVLLTLFCLCQDAGGCPPGFISYQNLSRCYFISDAVATFESAKKECVSKNSELTPVASYKEQLDLSSVLASKGWKCYGKENCMEFWIYIHRGGAQDPSWVTAELSGIGPSFWARGFPQANGDCVYMSFQDNVKQGAWRNDDCNRQLKYVCITCPYGFTYTHVTDECLYFNTQQKNWNDARQACTKLRPGAQLLTIKDTWKMVAVANFLFLKRFGEKDFRSCVIGGQPGKYNVAWIGGQTKDPQRCGTGFVWRPIGLAETPFTYAYWAPGNPNCNGNREFCVRIGNGDTDSLNWDDASCDQPSCSICEFK